MSSDRAERLSRELFGGLLRRLRCVEAVAQRAATIASELAGVDAEVVISGAWLHNIGYLDTHHGQPRPSSEQPITRCWHSPITAMQGQTTARAPTKNLLSYADERALLGHGPAATQ